MQAKGHDSGTKGHDSGTLQIPATPHCIYCLRLHYISFLSEPCCSVASFGEDLFLDSALLVSDNGKFDRLRPNVR